MARTVLFSDDFARTDGALGANWDDGYTGNFSLTIVSQVVRGSTLNADNTESQNVVSGVRWAGMTLATVGAFGFAITGMRIKVCMTAPPTNTFYWLQALINVAEAHAVLSRLDSGSETVLASDTTAGDWHNGDILIIESAQDGTLSGYVNGSLLLQTNDSNLSPDRSGIGLYIGPTGSMASVEYDDFQTGSITSGAYLLVKN